MFLTGPSLPPCLFLLLCLTLGHSENLSTADPSSASITNTTDLSLNISDPFPLIPEEPEEPEEQNVTRAECLVDNQMGLIAIGSAGGLIVCLLLTVLTLACQVHHLQRRAYIPRSSRSNLDLAGSTGFEGGLVGPCDNSVMLEEVKAQEGGAMELGDIREELGDIREELGDIREERNDEEEEEEEEEEEGSGLSPEEKPLMQRESSPDLPQGLEDMPLVV